MTNATVLLASSSPRRRMLLAAAGCDVRVVPSNADETWPGGQVEDAAMALAQRKLARVFDAAVKLPVVAADTVVWLDGAVLGKPLDAADAARMLNLLAGREHDVVTGFVVAVGARQHCQAVRTRVRFRPLSTPEIENYVATGESADKAGAYAIQGEGGALVDAVWGSYTNIIGLPLAEVMAALRQLLS